MSRLDARARICGKARRSRPQHGRQSHLLGENRPEWIACYWGCLIAGIIVVPIDYRSSAEFVAKVSRLVDARLILLGSDIPELPPGAEFGPAGVAVCRPRLARRRANAGYRRVAG